MDLFMFLVKPFALDEVAVLMMGEAMAHPFSSATVYIIGAGMFIEINAIVPFFIPERYRLLASLIWPASIPFVMGRFIGRAWVLFSSYLINRSYAGNKRKGTSNGYIGKAP